jgi:protein-S-isoprenylcysteine O-methyltransferase Ste14
MSRVLVLAYGVVAYLGFLGVFAAAVAFVGNVGVVRGIDAGPQEGMGQALVVDLALIALFGVSHSVMARGRFKERLVRVLPAAAERSTFVLVTDLTLGLLLWQWRPMPASVWDVESGFGRSALWALSAVGVLLVVYSTYLTDHFDLFGLRQVWLHARGRPYAAVPFQERSLYRYVRHPMMLGILLWFWATPTMSVGHLVFAAGMSVYVLVGVTLEERELSRHLGDEYRRYRARVGRFVPWRRA